MTKEGNRDSMLLPGLVELERPLHEMAHFHRIPGWLDGTTQHRLREFARQSLVIVNMGVWKGRSVAEMAEETQGVVFAIDHFLGSPESREGTQEQGRKAPISLYLEFLIYMKHFGLQDKVIPICAESTFAMQYFPDKSVDLVFIDGSHEEEATYIDCKGWGKKVKPGGILCGHDYNRQGVVNAVERYVAWLEGCTGDDIQLEVDEPMWIIRMKGV